MIRSRWNEEVEITMEGELLTRCLCISLRAYILHLHGISGGMFIHDTQGGVRAVGWRRPRREETRRKKGKHIVKCEPWMLASIDIRQVRMKV